jgi:hypothetical protein
VACNTVRAALGEWPVITQRIGWPYLDGALKRLLTRIWPECKGLLLPEAGRRQWDH